MTFSRRSGSGWTDIVTTVKRRAGGAWTNVSNIKRRSGGSWVQVWPLVRILDLNTTAESGLSNAAGTSHYRLNSSGVVEINAGDGTSYTSGGTWLLVGSNSDYQARATIVEDVNATLSGTFGSWLALSSTQTWTNANLGSGGGPSVATILVEIRDVATSTVRSSAQISFSSDYF